MLKLSVFVTDFKINLPFPTNTFDNVGNNINTNTTTYNNDVGNNTNTTTFNNNVGNTNTTTANYDVETTTTQTNNAFHIETTQKLGKKNNKNEKVLKFCNYFFI